MGRIDTLWLTDFRCYREVEVSVPPGVSVIGGANGQGKTSLLEAVHWVATTRSFRGVPNRSLIRSGAARAIIRATIGSSAGEPASREQLVEAELRATGRDRVLVNRQPLQRARDLLGVLRVTVFAPDDLQLVKGGPALRRQYLDELLVAIAPRYEAVRTDLDKVLKHRNALLRRGVRDDADRTTLEVFDSQLVELGGQLVRGRLSVIDRLLPLVAEANEDLAPGGGKVHASYRADWSDRHAADDVERAMLDALARERHHELERKVSLVGPHRDDWELSLEGLDARHHASQGEQRTLALALRLGGHRCVHDVVEDEPVLLLDDVFSELDPARARALAAHLPAAQTLVTTAVPLPEGIAPDGRFTVEGGRVEAGS